MPGNGNSSNSQNGDDASSSSGNNSSGNGNNSPGNNGGNNGNGNGNTGNNSGGNSGNSNSSVVVNYTLNEVIDISGARITNQQGAAADGTEVTHTTFQTTDLSGLDLTLREDLSGVVQSFYNDEVDQSSQTNVVLNQIKMYASKINCSDFQGKGTIDDYSQLFQAASRIANDTKQMQLDVDMEGFDEFGTAADDLSKLFNSFIVKLQTVSIIDDLNFLKSISAALEKIWKLSEVFGKFKETILATASVQIPKSSHDAKLLVQNVMSEVNCAMKYINHFVSPLPNDPVSANLSAKDRLVVDKAVATIDNWSVLCEQGVSIAMSNSPDIVYIKSASDQLKLNAGFLQKNTSTLKGKLALYNILQ